MPAIGAVAAITVSVAMAVVSGTADHRMPLAWSLARPTTHGTTVVGLMPGHGRRRRLGVSVAGRAAVAIPGVRPVSRDAVPRVGTDTGERVVVVYPRCVTGGRRCDLYEVGLDGRGERPVPGVNTPGSSEIQGAIDHGNVAFLRTVHGLDAWESSLYLRPAGGTARLLTRGGGYEVALAGDHVAQVHDTGPGEGMCGTPTVEVLDTSGAVRRVKSTVCGLDGQSFGSLDVAGGHLYFLASNGADGPARTTIFRTGVDGTGLVHADGPPRAADFAPTGPHTGVANVVHGYDRPTSMVAVGGLRFRAPRP